MVQAITRYIAAGANRHPATADWDTSGLLAYGADVNIALWEPQDSKLLGILSLLTGHTDTVNAVKFVPGSHGILLSGSVDRTLRVWKRKIEDSQHHDQHHHHHYQYACTQILTEHTSSINCIAVSIRTSNIFASGSADATVKIWSFQHNVVVLQQTIVITPRFFPLALALSSLIRSENSHVLAVAGTKDIIQLYLLDREQGADFKLQATLAGHEGWIRSLDFAHDISISNSDLLLSSASQDKYIRLWRIHQGVELPAIAASADPAAEVFMPGRALSNKAHRFTAQGLEFSATFEALLFGHEDWIYSVRWKAIGGQLQLLSASADNSLAIWKPDNETGVWVTVARMGEISSEKGSTTATGSTGGFWSGLWSPSGQTVVCLGRTGSWRLWKKDIQKDRWIQHVGISGHTKSVNDLTWSRKGDYLLSTSADQTTRLHACWQRGGKAASWHEMARPQIHGYDLNCIDSLGHTQFVSGAEEKLLRVFSEPKAVAHLLANLCGFHRIEIDDMPDAAHIPVLGLSNKAISPGSYEEEREEGGSYGGGGGQNLSTLSAMHPPLEDQLSRHTLWPEIEKLYGHGYEISALASRHNGHMIATACRATAREHAVIRLYETTTWHEIKPPLVAHLLTVTCLTFSSDDCYLLSVGRDRQWVLFRKVNTGSTDEEKKYKYTTFESNPKAHTRMILDAAWAPILNLPHLPRTTLLIATEIRIFATASRDKQVKIWAQQTQAHTSPSLSAHFIHQATIPQSHPVTAINFLDRPTHGKIWLAVGLETGWVGIWSLSLSVTEDVVGKWELDALEMGCLWSGPHSHSHPSKSITRLVWKRTRADGQVRADADVGDMKEDEIQLAIASEDSAIRLYSVILHS